MSQLRSSHPMTPPDQRGTEPFKDFVVGFSILFIVAAALATLVS